MYCYDLASRGTADRLPPLEDMRIGRQSCVKSLTEDLKKEETMCQYMDMTDKTCRVAGIEVESIDCASLKLCTGGRYEACPVYFVSFFIQNRLALRI